MPLFGSKDELPSFWKVQITGWIVYLVAIYVTFLSIAQPGNFLSLFYFKSFRALTGFFLTSVFLRPIYRKFGTNLSIGWLVLLVLVFSMLFGAVWTLIEACYVHFTNPNLDVATYLTRSPRIALDYALTLTAWSALYFGVKNWWSWQQERENSLESQALANKAQLEMLRYQLNPHFLFNALNSIRALVDEDEERAKQMITQLSEFLRFSLVNESAKKIPLSEEIEALRNYLAIEKIRFEDKLDVEFDIEARAAKMEVPCFLLNPLVENAIKHGLRGGAKPVEIRVSALSDRGRLVLEVVNSGNLQNGGNGTGIGLKNVRERLVNLYGNEGVLKPEQEDGFVKARIEIPPGN